MLNGVIDKTEKDFQQNVRFLKSIYPTILFLTPTIFHIYLVSVNLYKNKWFFFKFPHQDTTSYLVPWYLHQLHQTNMPYLSPNITLYPPSASDRGTAIIQQILSPNTATTNRRFAAPVKREWSSEAVSLIGTLAISMERIDQKGLETPPKSPKRPCKINFNCSCRIMKRTTI